MGRKNNDETAVAVAEYNAALSAAIIKARTNIRSVHPSGRMQAIQLATFVPDGTRESYVQAINNASACTVAIAGDKALTDDKPIGKSGGTVDLTTEAGEVYRPLLANSIIR